MYVTGHEFRKVYESRVKAILDQVIALYSGANRIDGIDYWGPNEAGSPNIAWSFAVIPEDAIVAVRDKRGKVAGHIYNISRVSFEVVSSDSPFFLPTSRIDFALVLERSDGTPEKPDKPDIRRLLDTGTPPTFVDPADAAAVEARFVRFEGLPYARLLAEQGWLTRPS